LYQSQNPGAALRYDSFRSFFVKRCCKSYTRQYGIPQAHLATAKTFNYTPKNMRDFWQKGWISIDVQ